MGVKFWRKFTLPLKMKNFFLERFSCIIEGDFSIFYKRFPWKKNYMEDIFKGISLINLKGFLFTPLASLARAAFYREFLL